MRRTSSVILVALAACDPQSDGHGTPTPPIHASGYPSDSAPTGVPSGHTAAPTGDTGEPCPPGGTQRRLEGVHDLATDAWATIVGRDTSGFGYGIAALGDVTGDNGPELAVLANTERYGSDRGGVWILPSPLPGGEVQALDVGVRMVDATPGDGFALWWTHPHGAMRPLADLNGDGLPEMAFSSSRYMSDDLTIVGQGAVFIVASPLVAAVGTAAPLEPEYARIGSVDAIQLGYTLAVGDVDGDGLEDLAASAPLTAYPDGSFRGEVYLFGGSLAAGETDEGSAAWRIFGDTSAPPLDGGPIAMGDQLVIEDLTADGVADLVVTSLSSSVDGMRTAGEVYVFEGPITADLSTRDATGTLSGEVEGDALGYVADGLGDTDGDGYGELGVSSFGADGAGSVYLLDGPIVGASAVAVRADARLVGVAAGDEAVYVSTVGDLDEDGLDDLTVGSVEVDGGGAGTLFLVYGAIPAGTWTIDTAANATFPGSGILGSTTRGAAAGDVDGDCMPDLMIGCGLGDRVYLMRGGTY